jgi:hypothetical protein
MMENTLLAPRGPASDHFEAAYAESIRADTRASLSEQCVTDRDVAEQYLDYCADHGPTTREQWIGLLEHAGCDLWASEYDRQARSWRDAMGDLA